ncbi:MAG: glucosyl-3-phosphoglycerate synthase [Chloroflexi bacterium]|nr:glucosyl-3-phosphoglycerate synthase [Chloroflexota bacterium]
MTSQNTLNQIRLNPTESVKNQNYSIVVPIFEDEQNEWLVRIGLNLARAKHGRVILVGLVLVPVGESLSTGVAQAQARRATLDRLRAYFEGQPILVKSRIRVVHVPWPSLARVVAHEHADSLIVPWLGEENSSHLTIDIERLVNELKCHVLIASHKAPTQPDRILLPTRGGKEAALALEVALSLARAAGATITLLHVTGGQQIPTSQQVYEELARMSQGDPRIKQELRIEGDTLSEIIAQAQDHDLVIIGASETPPGSKQPILGPIAHQLWQKGIKALLVVKTYQPPPLDRLTSWRRTEPLPTTTASVMVDRWFAENTFNSEEFENVARLVAAKEQQNLTISLGLPALNEEETVGNVIKTMQDTLMREFPLLDEIVLIDSGSTDKTVEIARDLGVPVYQHSEILPNCGAYQGKGEALWKSLHVLKGNLIAWIDTDIVNIHPRFVYGILGPLLQRETIQYVKGFYRRPLRVGDTLQAGGGGRVTELVARPLFNLFYPELSGVVQPLSGEYAGRRTALERVPFYMGYGVETGLLLSLVERQGISSIAQVDLRQRIHHNQPLGALSWMAFAIIQVFVDHLESRQKVQLLSEINRTMKIIRHEAASYYLEELVISDQCRPPIITIPEYRAEHGITDWPEEELPRQQQDNNKESAAV